MLSLFALIVIAAVVIGMILCGCATLAHDGQKRNGYASRKSQIRKARIALQ